MNVLVLPWRLVVGNIAMRILCEESGFVGEVIQPDSSGKVRITHRIRQHREYGFESFEMAEAITKMVAKRCLKR